ncbi:abc transporter b family member 18, partial [Quercus suber]
GFVVWLTVGKEASRGPCLIIQLLFEMDSWIGDNDWVLPTESENGKLEPISKTGLFSYSDALDKLLMLFGTLGSIGDGSMTPLTMFILSGLVNDFSGAGFDIPNEVVDKK